MRTLGERVTKMPSLLRGKALACPSSCLSSQCPWEAVWAQGELIPGPGLALSFLVRTRKEWAGWAEACQVAQCCAFRTPRHRKQNLSVHPSGWPVTLEMQPEPRTSSSHQESHTPHDSQLALPTTFPLAFSESSNHAAGCSKLLCWHAIFT